MMLGIDEKDVRIATEFVESAAEYYGAISKEPFDLAEYRRAEFKLHEKAAAYGERLHAIRNGEE